MRKIFIDIGGHRGQSVHQFFKEVADAKDWKIFSFEPVEFEALITNVNHLPNVKCMDGVAGAFDGFMDLFQVPAGGQGATVLKGKTSGGVDESKKKQVECFDFIRWFKENIEEDDLVVIKMNIEGGEYVLMPRLLEVLSQISSIWIKLHHSKFVNNERPKLIKILNSFSEASKGYDAFVFLDETENPYNFKWLIDNAK